MPSQLQNQILRAYSPETATKHVEVLASCGEKAPGNYAQDKACNYIVDELEKYGLEVEVQKFDCFTGYRGDGKLHLLSPEEKEIRCVIQAFSGSTPSAGVEGELVYVSDFNQVHTGEVTGRVILLDGAGMAQIEQASVMEAAGAIGQIYAMPLDQNAIRCIQNKSTWGNPTPDDLKSLPRNPIASITKKDADHLKGLCRIGPVKIRITANAFVGWKLAKQPIGTLYGKNRKKHVMLTSHYCSWWDGAIDNCAAVALNLELARVFAQHRKQLKRSVKFAFWMGHTHATYAGSTYYVDSKWDEVNAHMIAELNLESPGAAGNSCPPYIAFGQAEFRALHLRAIGEVTGLEPRSRSLSAERVPKIGDSSFWGVGVPRVAFDMLKEPFDMWFWHTDEDKVDKVKMEAAMAIFQVYSLCALRILNSQVIPADFTTVADEYEHALAEMQSTGSIIDLASLREKARLFRKEAARLNRAARKAKGKNAAKIDDCLMKLSRITMSPLYQEKGRYAHDKAGRNKKPLPGLQPMLKLSSSDKPREGVMLAYTALLRERNRVSDALEQAIELIKRTCANPL